MVVPQLTLFGKLELLVAYGNKISSLKLAISRKLFPINRGATCIVEILDKVASTSGTYGGMVRGHPGTGDLYFIAGSASQGDLALRRQRDYLTNAMAPPA